MGLLLQLDLEEPQPLASNTGWSDFLDWVEQQGESPVLRHLCKFGWSQNPNELKREIKSALKKAPPKDERLRVTISNLLVLLESAGRFEVVSVTDGLEPS